MGLGNKGCKCHAHFTWRAARDILILVLKKELSNKAFLIHRAGYCIKLDRHKSKDKEDTGCFEINLMFWTWVLFFLAFHALKTGFELSNVKLCRHVPLKGNKLVSGRFELSRVRVKEGKITVNVWRKSGAIDFGSSKREIRVSEGSSYRESTVVLGSSSSECCRFFKNES